MWVQSTNPAHSVEVPDADDVPDDVDPEDLVEGLSATFADPTVRDLNDGEPVTFNRNGRAQVSKEVGEHLVDTYDAFETTDGAGPGSEPDTEGGDGADAPDEDEDGADEDD